MVARPLLPTLQAALESSQTHIWSRFASDARRRDLSSSVDMCYLQLDPNKRTVEVVKLFVEPTQRRAGIATRLFATIKAKALEEGIDQLYLHTHPFLPGAISFWERLGFSLLHIDDDPVWHTTHMKLSLCN